MIKRDPTNAKLYIEKANEMETHKSPPQEIIKLSEKGLQQKLKITKKEEATIYIGLGNNYQYINKKKALFAYKKAINIYPEFKHLKNIIGELEKEVKY